MRQFKYSWVVNICSKRPIGPHIAFGKLHTANENNGRVQRNSKTEIIANANEDWLEKSTIIICQTTT